MKGLSTKISIVVFALTLFSWSNIFAQSHTLSFTAPADLGDVTHPVQIAAFGPDACDIPSFSGELILVIDSLMGTTACDTILNDLTGKIAVIDRGGCGFVDKAFNAQLKGATAMLLISNDADNIFTMGGSNPDITIPSFMVSSVDGDTFRGLIDQGVNVSFDINVLVDESTDNILWGNEPGEGDFDGGLNDWTTNTVSCANEGADLTFQVWNWVDKGIALGTCGNNQIFSYSFCNGAAAFESDFHDNGDATVGCAAQQGQGPCATTSVGDLISPNIDLSQSGAAGYTVRFRQMARKFTNSQYFVAWSSDMGATWDSVEINQDLAVNAAALNNEVDIPLSTAAGADNVMVRFHHVGTYYYWIIDDVRIVEQKANNMAIPADGFTIAQNAQTPLALAEPMYFFTNVENVGAVEQTNVTVDLSITNADGDVVFTDAVVYDAVAGNGIPETDLPFPTQFTPFASGDYTATYTISADEADQDSTDNSQSFIFNVNNEETGILAKDLGGATTALRPGAAAWPDGAPLNYAVGNLYHVPDVEDCLSAESVTFAFDRLAADSAALAGQFITLSLSKWTDANEDGDAQLEEREFTAFAGYVIEGFEDSDTLLTIAFEGGPIPLEPNTDYLLMAEWDAAGALDLAPFIASNENFDYGLTVAANLFFEEFPDRRAAFLGVGDATGQLGTYEAGGFAGATPTVRLNMANCMVTSTENVLNERKEFAVYPNPAQDQLNLRLELAEPATELTFQLLDLAGRVVIQQQYENVFREIFTYDTAKLAPGTYFVNLITDNGTGVKRIVIQ